MMHFPISRFLCRRHPLHLAAALLALAAGTAAQAAPVQWSGNGHYYEFISGSRSWSSALTDASTRSFNGLTGYLATITSAEEQSFLYSRFPSYRAWLGGSDAAQEGTWKWMSGPEAGQVFYIQGAAVQPGYSNWNPGDPNNYGVENALELLSYAWQGRWNDLSAWNTAPQGYLVEYSSFTAGTAVPEPATLALLGAAGLAGLARRRRRAG